MHLIKLKDQKKLADCLAHSTDDPLTVIRFVDKFKELFPAIQMPFYYLEVEANAKLDAQAEIAMIEAEDRGLIAAKDRRVA